MTPTKIKLGSYNVIVKDISEGKVKAYMATIPALNDSLAFAPNLKELKEGVLLTIDLAKKRGIAKKRTKKHLAIHKTKLKPAIAA